MRFQTFVTDGCGMQAWPLPLHLSYLKEVKFDGHVLVLDHKSGDLAASEG